MRKSAMPEVKFKKREREVKSDAMIIADLRKDNWGLSNQVDSLRESMEELHRNYEGRLAIMRQDYEARIAELEKIIERLS